MAVVAKTTVEAFTLTREAYRNSVVESIKRQRASLEEFPIFPKMRPTTREALAPVGVDEFEGILPSNANTR